MRKIILYIFGIILLAVLSNTAIAQPAFPSSSHTFISWDKYGNKGSFMVDIPGISKEDSANYAPYSASFRAGYWGLNKGTVINTPSSRYAIIAPVAGMLAFDTTTKKFYGYDGLTWTRLDSAGSGGSTDTSSLSARIDARVKYTDTGGMLDPYLRKIDTTNKWLPTGTTYVASETDPVFTASDAFSITSTDKSNWTAGYNDKINSAAFTGTSTKTLTLTQQDGGTVTANFSDANTTYSNGYGLDLSGTTFSVDTGEIATQYDISGFQAALNEGFAIDIVNPGATIQVDTVELKTAMYSKYQVDSAIAAAGGGGTPDFDDVLAAGETATSRNAIIENGTSGTARGYKVQNGASDRASLTVRNGAGRMDVKSADGATTSTVSPTALTINNVVYSTGSSGTIAVTSQLPPYTYVTATGTTSGLPTTLGSIAVASGETIIIKATYTAENTINTAAGVTWMLARNIGGTLNAVSSYDIVALSGNLMTATASLGVVGSNVVLSIETAPPDGTVTWNAIFEYVKY